VFNDIITNNTLIIPLCAWAIAQTLKVLIILMLKRQLDLRLLVYSGGMPSSHSALATALTTSVAFIEGFGSVAFAISVVFTMVVMYDAAGVRRSVGEQSILLNRIIREFRNRRPATVWGDDLREFVGHTPLQVIIGALIGVTVACSWLLVAGI